MNIFDDLLSGVTAIASNLWPQPSEKPGISDGKLRPCPGTPNCVSSEPGTAPAASVPPFALSGSPEDAWPRLKQAVTKVGGTVRGESDGYLWTTFLVPVFGFTDDVEFRLDVPAKVIHVRSASRIGYSDLGVNRSRVEQIRDAFIGKP
ncbi:MAG: DUF1499 domain-containing protein [Chlorobiaceae bacterium]|nr:DUF1499 domain-containing protein [Chlorobiaceae bacterium]